MIIQLFQRYLDFVTRRPRTLLFVVAGFAVFMAAGLPNFKLDASSDSLTLENDADLDFYREISRQYQSGDFLVVTYRPKQDLFSDAALDNLRALKTDLAKIEGIVSVDSMLNVPLLYSPKQSLSEIVEEPRTLLDSNVDRTLAKKEFLTSPIYRDLILSEDGQTTAIQLSLRVDNKYISLVQERDTLRLKKKTDGLTVEEARRLPEVTNEFLQYRTLTEARNHERVEEVREVVARYRDDAQIFVGGVTMITADMITYIRSDLIVFGVAVVIFMIAILAFIFRSARFVLVPMMSCLVSVLIMLGYVSWLDWRLTVISSNFVALLLIVSLAVIIHLIVRYRELENQHADWDQKQLVKTTLSLMAVPCFYTTITTIVAFASLVVSGIKPVIDFGWMMSIGLVVALILAFVIMPASLMLLPREAQVKVSEQSSKPAFTLLFSRMVEHGGRWILAGAVVVAILSALGISRLDVENRFIDYFHDTTEIHQGLSVIDNELGGTTSLEIIVTVDDALTFEVVDFGQDDDEFGDEFSEGDPFASGDPFSEGDPFAADDPFASEELIDDNPYKNNYWVTVGGVKKIERLHDYLESLPEVGKVQSLATLYKVGKDINGSMNAFELAVMVKSMPESVRGVLIDPFIEGSGVQTRLTMRIKDLYPGLNRTELVERIKEDIVEKQIFNAGEAKFTGLLVLYNNMLQSLFSSQILTLGVVFLCITIMFMVLFRSIKLAAVAIVPNILASLSILGAMGLMGIPLDMMTITVAGITLGIGVDDTIHYVHRFRHEIQQDGDYIASMHRSHGSIGRAVYYTSIIIIFGFSIMVLSKFIPTIYFGLLTGLAMLAALLATLLLLPKLILMFKPFTPAQQG